MLGERRAQEKARAILHFMNLDEYTDTPAGDLAVGLGQHIEIGRALCLEPRLLLLDEPSTGLDARETAELAHLLAAVRKRFAVSMLIVDHDMALIMRICNRIYVLDYGGISSRTARRRRSATTRTSCGRISAAGGGGRMSALRFQARGIRTGYGRLPVVFDIDLEVHEGEIVALLGANGAGQRRRCARWRDVAAPRRRHRARRAVAQGPRAGENRARRRRPRSAGPRHLPEPPRRGRRCASPAQWQA